MAEICQCVQDGYKIPVELAPSIVVPVFKENFDNRTAAIIELKSLMSME